MERLVPLRMVEAFYLRMAAATYAAGEKPEVLASGRKGYEREEQGLRFIDWWESIGEFSFGETRIYVDDSLVWRMSYQGHLKDAPGVTELLKMALCHNYSSGVFDGGRGPREMLADTPFGPHQLVYHNDLYIYRGFVEFGGVDYIVRRAWPWEWLYRHQYYGGLMVPREYLAG